MGKDSKDHMRKIYIDYFIRKKTQMYYRVVAETFWTSRKYYQPKNYKVPCAGYLQAFIVSKSV